ncbi:hypothetical protein SAMN04488515_1562 [Cognatiyoonia koreensis]|uniref:Uncharacterized protein n=1 Tax=Cognatiyoonia koreensis TaxID=364200 RepID=A0A1I0Q065_9RHOB|nr:hypothetical protein [Cognatiyoonia koreensis]SEW20134.1 hypothetical protein SAMN04488515_1562 [Cognatiyoonia koreensis]
MNQIKKSQLFLERKSYRQRRLRDAVRILPVFGAILWFVPLMWNTGDGTSTSNADAMLYVFGVWIVLIVVCALITRGLKPETEPK